MSTGMIYKDVDLIIYESDKEILINPVGERFYIDFGDINYVYRNAIVFYNEDTKKLEIVGEKTIHTEHFDRGFNFEKLAARHPIELIVKRKFLGITWYSVKGTMTREVKTSYICRHQRDQYLIDERQEIVTTKIQKDPK